MSEQGSVPDHVIVAKSFRCEALDRAVNYSVYLPEGPVPQGGWPLVLLLHGAGRHHRAIADDPLCRALVLAQPFAIVFPDGGGFYTDSPVDAKLRHQSAIHELLALMRRELPVCARPEKTGICGWSMGGYGAIRFVESFPKDVRVVASGIGLLDYPNKDWPIQEFGVDPRFGNDPEQWGHFNCMTHAEALRGHDILIVAATEAWDYPQNERFHRRLLELDIAHEYRRIAGAHTFPSVRACMPAWFDFMTRRWTADS